MDQRTRASFLLLHCAVTVCGKVCPPSGPLVDDVGSGSVESSGDNCDTTCHPGTYGADCSRRCSRGCSDTCDSVDGSCSCRPGYTGDICDKRCPEGKYGQNCLHPCSPGCMYPLCHRVTGECLICSPGWTHSDLNRRCDISCNTYGGNCTLYCSPDCVKTSYHPKSGDSELEHKVADSGKASPGEEGHATTVSRF